MNKRELYFEIQKEVRELEVEFYDLAPINILIANIEDKFKEKEILNGISDLIDKNIIEKIDKNYLRSCY